MSFLNTLISYLIALSPILIWWLVCTKIKDYGVLMILEIVICHILLPNIFRALIGGFYISYQGSYYQFSFRSTGGQAGGIVVVYLIGYLLFSFWKGSTLWNYSEQKILIPGFKNNVFTIIYAIIVALIALFVFPVSEHFFYYYFCLMNVDGRTGYLAVLIMTLICVAKYYFLFSNSVQDKNAGIFWTILWGLMYIMIDFGSRDAKYWNNWYYGGIGLKQVINLLYIISLTLWGLGVQFPKPSNVQKTAPDNKLNGIL